MLKDITLGQYYSSSSFMHSLDGRTKFFFLLLFIVSLFVIDNLLLFIIPFILLVIAIRKSSVPFRLILKGLNAIKFLLLLSVIISFISGGIINASMILLRFVFIVVSSSLFTLTTTVSQISDTFQWYLSPLKIFKVNVKDTAMIFSIALRFIPVLSEEAQNIMMSQKARGAKIDQGSLIQRAKAIIPLIVPIFVQAIRKATELSDALVARSYGLYEDRTRLNPLRFTKLDLYALLVFALYIILIIGGKIYVC